MIAQGWMTKENFAFKLSERDPNEEEMEADPGKSPRFMDYNDRY